MINLVELVLQTGAHDDRSSGLCFMEAVAWVANEPHSDHPECVCPVLAAFLRPWNDSLDKATRQRLKPYISRVIGTNDAHSDERAWLAIDWIIREYTPAWLELAKLTEHGTNLRTLPAITGPQTLARAAGVLADARDVSAAARDAARDAARAAAWAAAWDAASAAASAAARDVLKPTTSALQESVFQLLDRMIAVGAIERRIA